LNASKRSLSSEQIRDAVDFESFPSPTPRNRVATPVEFAALLEALELEDALPYALAGYAMGRLSQIQRLRWREVDLRIGAIEWGVDVEARKSPAARRLVPTLKPLLALLKRVWIKQGCPGGEELVCPPRRRRPDGLLHSGGLSARANERWEESGLEPIGLHECRHTSATWLDAAGISPKVASVLMGHAIPDHQPGAASITLARYTHTLPDAIETARRQLDAWLEQQLSSSAFSAGPTR
jgi:integrase